MRTHLNKNQSKENMKTRLTALIIGLALTATVHAQNVATVISSNLFEPNSVATDANSVAYITDGANNRIIKFDSSVGTMVSIAGFTGVTGTNNGTGIAARFYQPAGIVYARGGLIVADSANQLLRFVTVAGVVSNLAGVWSEDGGLVDGAANSAQFSFPLGLAADAAGNIYIADSGNGAIRKLDTNNTVSTIKTGLYQPSAVAVTTNGDLWVADTRHHVIQLIQTNGTMSVIAGALNSPGTNDSVIATDARFNMPSGVYFISTASGLLISDTGNNTVRRLYYNIQLGTYSVETVAGQAGHSGLTDGAPLTARFNAPIGICADPLNTGFYVVDRAGSALRRLQMTAPQPPVGDPVVGFVTFLTDPSTGMQVSQFNKAITGVFNNRYIIAIKGETGTQTFITYGPTPPNTFEDSIPTPNAQTGVSPTIYKGDNLPPELTAPSIVPLMPDITIKSIGMEDGRRPSAIFTNRFQFKVANPSINGENAAAFEFDDITTNCAIYYTTNGTDPTLGPPSLGPAVSGQKISLAITNDTVIKCKAFLDNFSPSEIVSKTLSVSNFNANKISLGFAAGEASSDYVAAAGQRFYAPVTLSTLDGQTIYSLQFNVTVTNLGVAPSVQANKFNFTSMLMRPDTAHAGEFLQIPPAMFIGTNIFDGSPIFDDMEFTNTAENLLGVGWFERYGETNLYFTKTQDLITYSIVHNKMFRSFDKKIVLGGYAFDVPTNAADGQKYQIQISRPSGTEDGVAQPVFIQAPTNNTTGPGTINSIKNITVGSRPYLVGDSVPFRWFNAGDFGDNVLNNADIMDLFQGVVYGLNQPPDGSDFFDCMDSSNGSIGSLDGNDTTINGITTGDQVLAVDDIYVTFRRSLDPGLTWYQRYWSNGVRQVQAVANVVPGSGSGGGSSGSIMTPKLATGPRFVNVAPDDVMGAPGATVTIPVRASVVGNLPIKVMALNIDVTPLDGSPVITVPVTFTPAAGLGSATLTTSQGAGNYAGCWLSTSTAGVSGTNVLGTLTVTLPTNATPSSAWAVHFSHLTVSPNGIGLFPLTMQDSLITCANRSGSSWGDGIPDSWRLRWFGSVSNLLSGANLDPDNDGHTNLAEFKAGTNPLDRVSHLNLKCANAAPSSALSWPSVFGKLYTVESSSTLFGGSWSVIGTNLSGTGQTMQFSDPNPAGGMRFYRVKVQ